MKVAIVHYWLVNMRGGEKMLSALLEIFPEADIYTHVYNPLSVSPLINKHKITSSFINRLPFAKKLYPIYMPLMPAALNDFNLQEYDLIISSEAGPAKGVIPAPDAYHLCYCHTPMRYVWDLYHEYFKNAPPLQKFFMKRLVPSLRVWDITSSYLVDRFITNSNWTAKRILRYYNRKADVVFGPADVEKYFCVQRNIKDYYLFFGQLTDNKKVDIAIEACISIKRKLIIAGGGAKKKLMEKYKKSPFIEFAGRISDERLISCFAEAKALLFPGIEDMGLVPIEANAAGCPVIAYRKGGVLDTIKENSTGIFFDRQTSESLSAAILDFEHIEQNFQNREVFTQWTKQFSKELFIERVKKIISERKRI
ncbi:MAG: glycosyltransferase [Spirochaetaceae bacterium]|jgi:glycosyltransferase involved in cell wall biosynthesis|nr:glycosyltransferase [Spirochaetaceae bacterium]